MLAAPEKGAKTNGPKQSETDATPGDGGCGRPPLTEPAAPARRAWRTREPPWHGARRRAAATSWRLRTGVQRRARGSAAGTRGADLARGRRHRPASAGQPASDLTCDITDSLKCFGRVAGRNKRDFKLPNLRILVIYANLTALVCLMSGVSDRFLLQRSSTGGRCTACRVSASEASG